MSVVVSSPVVFLFYNSAQVSNVRSTHERAPKNTPALFGLRWLNVLLTYLGRCIYSMADPGMYAYKSRNFFFLKKNDRFSSRRLNLHGSEDESLQTISPLRPSPNPTGSILSDRPIHETVQDLFDAGIVPD